MAAKLDVRSFPTTVRSARSGQTGGLPEAPNQVIDIQHEQILEVGVLSNPMHGVWVNPHVMEGELLQETGVQALKMIRKLDLPVQCIPGESEFFIQGFQREHPRPSRLIRWGHVIMLLIQLSLIS